MPEVIKLAVGPLLLAIKVVYGKRLLFLTHLILHTVECKI